MMLRAIPILLATAVPTVSAGAQSSGDCSALAAALGVAPEAKALDAARDACAEAVKANPGAADLLHHYARTLELSGALAAATRLYEWAAGDGYQPARQALERLNGEPAPDVAETVAVDGESASDVAETEGGEAHAAAAVDLAFPGFETAGPGVGDLPPMSAAPSGSVDLGVMRDRVLAIADRFPVADYAVEPLADTLSGDPIAAFAYVRDHIAYQPYAGILRGASGALSARAGNAEDHALLLALLLNRMGIQTRFAVATLDEAGIGRLRVAALQPSGDAAMPADAAARLAGLSPESLARFAARARRDFAWLWPVVGSRLSASPPASISVRHVWVQALIDGTWTDLDPTLPDSRPGQALAVPEATIDVLPDGDRHTVSIAVVAETLADGKLQAAPVLETRLTAEEAAGSQIFLAFTPNAGGGLAGLGASIAGMGGDRSGYLPVLIVGDELRPGAAIPNPGAVTGGEPGSLFGESAKDFFFGGKEQGREAGPLLTGLYLDIGILVPGRDPVTSRRILIDRVPAAQRSAGAIDASALVPVPDDAGAPIPYRTVHQIVVSTGADSPRDTAIGMAVAADYVGARMATPDDLAGLSLQELLWPVGAFNQAVVLASEQLSVAALNDRHDARFFVGEPRVFILSFSPRDYAAGQGLAFSIDLLHDGVSAVAAADVADDAIAARRLWYGVLQSALETTVAEVRSSGYGDDSRQVTSTSMAMTPDLTVFTTQDRARLADSAPAGVIADLAAGRMVVANAGGLSPALATWWAVDPDGGTRAVLAPGLGGSKYNGRRIPPTNGVNATPNNLPRDYLPQSRAYYRGRPPPPKPCSGPNEYMTVLGCVSLPAGMALGTAYAIVVGEVVFFAALIIAASGS